MSPHTKIRQRTFIPTPLKREIVCHLRLDKNNASGKDERKKQSGFLAEEAPGFLVTRFFQDSGNVIDYFFSVGAVVPPPPPPAVTLVGVLLPPPPPQPVNRAKLKTNTSRDRTRFMELSFRLRVTGDTNPTALGIR
jgi:hypothetical protein